MIAAAPSTVPIPLTLKRADPAGDGTFSGLAATFGPMPDRQGDVIEPGAFTRTLADWRARGSRIPLLWQHDPAEPIGALASARETVEGLEVEGEIALATGNGARAFSLLKVGGLSMSIGFWIPLGGAEERDGARYIHEVDLIEVSLVAIPASSGAVVRAAKAACYRSRKDFEHAARDALGLSAREAKRLAAGGWSELVRDAPAEPDSSARAISAALTRIIESR